MKRRDLHIICECQRHARRERTLWRRSVRGARATANLLRRGGVALLICVPLTFGAINAPSEAMDAVSVRIAHLALNRFPIFTTERVREDFLAPRETQAPRTLTIAVMREQFFRTEVPYGPIIYREALKNDLPPELVAAVVEAESDFRPRLVSGKNAQGLMQIIPTTGRLLGTNDLFDPEANVAAGAKYLKYLLNRFDDPRVALAAYNAGEGNVEKFKGVPPFPETLNYIRRVNERSREYRDRIRVTVLLSARLQPTVH
jgi:soluble lytic murein transglycosylase-like protein